MGVLGSRKKPTTEILEQNPPATDERGNGAGSTRAPSLEPGEPSVGPAPKISTRLPKPLEILLRVAFFLLLIYLFLVAIELFGGAMKKLGADSAKALVTGLENPFAGLAVGVLATVLVQSSSVTTSLVVGMVGTGILPLAIAVPMIMGANIGTSITNTLVACGHITRSNEFRRAFAGATVHDFFNLLTVAILFPLELATGFLRSSAEAIVHVFPVGSGAEFKSPIKAWVKWFAGVIHSNVEALGLTGGALSAALIGVALVLIFLSLSLITRNMRLLMADRIEGWLNRVLGRSGLLGLTIGIVATVLVQSSSITTSLLVPLFGAGILTIQAGFPIMVGANIGTTVTALLAASVAGAAGLTIALVHLCFNLCGTAIFMGIRPMQRLPIGAANGLAALAIRNRIWVLLYILTVFVLVPVAGVLIWRS